ncbi:hypothetical protein EN833_23360 [Mesorhizobium sp. M4B.F.Ca.ET.190.01.1.1]|uniref:hypothetical protein n=1 Tax=unclassified Mesorhizobium TaxID=325217 RepID=UPI00109333F4|nr:MULTISPECIES: hypothetical protein [unclassified Mesorhizobium]TGR05413.1 hypothetical protein EN843_23350 [Mesorhizobium sp. M4B.F.Ca.ET.200.01.1.1]TGS15669.1 hypothetical protein EN833_23360 [Mesorhizobium sp. M4B.F.Ca.ET.190.01.1.1]TGT27729.1 hypothetical protein EN815_23335 [Mesorhizobium sp. M4B.F.Ca.ET.172.01.1.1]
MKTAFNDNSSPAPTVSASLRNSDVDPQHSNRRWTRKGSEPVRERSANLQSVTPPGGVTVNVDSERLPLGDPKFARSHIDVLTTSNVAPRWKLSRERERAGLIVLKVVIEDAHITWLLTSTGDLDPLKADDKDAIARALEKYLARGRPANFDV